MARLKKRLSIVFVDDAPPPRALIAGLVRAEPGLRVLAVPADLKALERTVRETRPDLVLLNLARNGRGRLTFAAALRRAAPAVPVIIMGLAPRRDDVVSLVRAGAAGFIMANAPMAVRVRTILLVARGDRILPPDLTHGVFAQLRRRYRAPRSPSLPTPFRLSVKQARS